jgi:hypothetical protein
VSLRHLLHHGRRGVPRILHRTQQSALPSAAYRVLAHGIVQKNPVIAWHRTGRRNRADRWANASIPVKGVYRAKRAACTRHRACLEGTFIIDTEKYLILVAASPRRRTHRGHIRKRDNGTRCVDCNYDRLRMPCTNNSRKQRNPDFHAAADIL